MPQSLIASFGKPMPTCKSCRSKMVMSCREVPSSEAHLFTFECRYCHSVVQLKVKDGESNAPMLHSAS
jgi:hypothetical protein